MKNYLKSIGKILVFLLFFLTFGFIFKASPSEENMYIYKDVTPNHWAYRSIIITKKIFGGYPDGTFRGEKYIERYEAAIRICRLVDTYPFLKKYERNNNIFPYPDVPRDHWVYGAIECISKYGIGDDYDDGLFKGRKFITRYQTAKWIFKLLNLENEIQKSNDIVFKDIILDNKEGKYVVIVTDLGIIHGYPDGTFKGKQFITRYEMVATLSNLIHYIIKL